MNAEIAMSNWKSRIAHAALTRPIAAMYSSGITANTSVPAVVGSFNIAGLGGPDFGGYSAILSSIHERGDLRRFDEHPNR